MADLKTAPLSALLEAYGIAVRAGVITPCAEDEAAFRQILGLPAMPESVIKDWASSDGVRRPITLQRPGQTEETGQPTPEAMGSAL